MKKIIFLFAMLLAVTGVQAKTDRFACNQTLSSSYSWTGTNKQIKLFENLSSVDKSKYKNLHVKISNKNNVSYVRLQIMCSDNYSTASWHKDYYSSTEFTVDLTAETYKDENSTATERTYSDISRIYLTAFSSNASQEASFSISVDDIYLETAEYENMEITTTIDSSSDKETPFAWTATETLSTIANNLGKTDAAVIFGYANNNNDAHGSFNVTGYDNVTVNLSAFDGEKNTSVRLLKGTGTSNVEFTTASGTLSYTKDLTFTTCASIKAGAGASNCQNISSIVFTKDFAAASTTAFSIAASASSSVAYDRSFTAGQASTICLPFALNETEVSAAGKFYAFTGVNGSTLNFTKVSTTEAYTPYVFIPAVATPFANLTEKTIVSSDSKDCKVPNGSYTFQGTLAKEDVPVDAYGYSGGEFKKAGSGVTIKAFRAYFTASGSSKQSLNINLVDDETGVEEIAEQQAANFTGGVAYNMAGMRVGKDYKGIVIVNGKKIMQ